MTSCCQLYLPHLCVPEAIMAVQGGCTDVPDACCAACLWVAHWEGGLRTFLGVVKRLCMLMGRVSACRFMWVLDFNPGWP